MLTFSLRIAWYKLAIASYKVRIARHKQSFPVKIRTLQLTILRDKKHLHEKSELQVFILQFWLYFSQLLV